MVQAAEVLVARTSIDKCHDNNTVPLYGRNIPGCRVTIGVHST